MLLQQQIKEDMKTAMKAKESAKVMTLRGVMSAVTNKLVDLGRGPQGELEDAEVISVIKTEVKRRKDAIQQYVDAGRPELAADETVELEVLQPYLPETMSVEAIKEVVMAKMSEMGVTDKSGMGQLMGAVMSELGGKVDGANVKTAVDEALS